MPGMIVVKSDRKDREVLGVLISSRGKQFLTAAVASRLQVVFVVC